MCFFFKKKPKFDWDKVKELIEVAMNHLDMKGFPAKNERNEENWKLEMVNDEYGVGGFLTCTVDGLAWGISMYFSKSFSELRRGMSFKNTRLSDKHLNELRSKYPFLLFRMSANDTLGIDDKPQGKEYLAKGIKCKKLEDIIPAINKYADDFAYLSIYDNVKKMIEEEKAGK
ncbi:MAG: hypothetical protein J6U92_06380 [Clostridia bacterium]|nr:hypothetical protein [Clostridia bacterium]